MKHWGRGDDGDDDDDDNDDDDDDDDDGLMISFIAKGGKCYCSVSYRTGVCLRICPHCLRRTGIKRSKSTGRLPLETENNVGEHDTMICLCFRKAKWQPQSWTKVRDNLWFVCVCVCV